MYRVLHCNYYKWGAVTRVQALNQKEILLQSKKCHSFKISKYLPKLHNFNSTFVDTSDDIRALAYIPHIRTFQVTLNLALRIT